MRERAAIRTYNDLLGFAPGHVQRQRHREQPQAAVRGWELTRSRAAARHCPVAGGQLPRMPCAPFEFALQWLPGPGQDARGSGRLKSRQFTSSRASTGPVRGSGSRNASLRSSGDRLSEGAARSPQISGDDFALRLVETHRRMPVTFKTSKNCESFHMDRALVKTFYL